MVDGGHVFPMSFLGLYSPLAAAILHGPRGQTSALKLRISAAPDFGAASEVVNFRSDHTFARASPGLRS